MTDKTFTVFYDGSCPLCVREISFYRKRTSQQPISWLDVSEEKPELATIGLSQCDAMARFHVMNERGELFNGARAFILLWQQYKGFRVAGRILALPGLLQISEYSYRLFLKIRPSIQTLVRRL